MTKKTWHELCRECQGSEHLYYSVDGLVVYNRLGVELRFQLPDVFKSVNWIHTRIWRELRLCEN